MDIDTFIGTGTYFDMPNIQDEYICIRSIGKLPNDEFEMGRVAFSGKEQICMPQFQYEYILISESLRSSRR